MDKRNLINPSVRKYALYFLLLTSISFLFFINFFGLDFTDSFFHLNNIDKSQEKHMTFLSYIILGGWTQIFGNALISLRIFNSVLTILAVFIPFLLFRRNVNNYTILFGAIAVFILTSTHSNVIGYDIITRFFLVLLFSFVLKFVHTNKLYWFILVGIFSVLLIGARFQNIIIVPILLLLYFIYFSFISGKQIRQYISIYVKRSAIYLFFICTIGAIGAFVFFDNSSQFLGRTFGVVKNILFSDNPYNSHSFTVLLRAYIRDIFKVLQYLGFLFLIKYMFSFKFKNKIVQFIFVGITILLFVFFTFVGVIYIDKNFYFSPFYASIILFILIESGRRSFVEKRYNQVFLIIAIILFSFVPPLGSNTGLFKFYPFLVTIFPITTFFYKYNLSKHTILCLFIVLFYASYTRLNHTNEDGRLTAHIKNNMTTSIPKLEPIRTSPERVDYLQKIYKDYKNDFSKHAKVLFFGRVSHIVYYITENKPYYHQSFGMQPDSRREILQAEKIVKEKQPIVYYMPDYPNEENKERLQQEVSLFEKMLLKNGYIEINKGQYKRYEPKAY